ncbi:MAG: hypothetical protein FWD23_03275 [Oscillospiraceae bacterium]|nr:hypothetical protein [Oscillospiraceae bacterium]
MTHKERQLATIHRKNTDRVSTDVIRVENGEKILGKPVNYDSEELLTLLGIDGRIVFPPWYTGEITDDIKWWWSGAYDDYGTSHRYPLQDIQSAAELKRKKTPNPDLYDWASKAAEARKYSGEYAVRGPYMLAPFCVQNSLFGMEECMMRMLTDTKVFEASLEMIFEHSYRFCENYIKALGDDLDIFYFGDDVGTQRGMMFDPALWRKYYKNIFRAFCDLGKKYGKPAWFHSCGDITSILPDLIDIGINVWETVQLHTLPVSPEKLKQEYGKDITFFGGVNTQFLPYNTPEKVREEALYCMRVLGEDGGYILGPDHHIKPDVSAENTLALFHAPL